MKGSVLTFGELLLRFQEEESSEVKGDLGSMTISVGGSEANVAATLPALGVPADYFTVLPEHNIAKKSAAVLQQNNTNTSKILWKGLRMGSYFLQSSNGLSTGEVIYDRKFSSYYQLKESDIDFDALFENCSWFHWTAITPALSAEWAVLIEKVLREAQKRGLYISVDMNYRSKLWDYGVHPVEVMPKLVAYCDVVMGNIWAYNKMLGFDVSPELNRNTDKEKYFEVSTQISNQMFQRFPKCKHISNTFRFMDNSKHNLLYATYHQPAGDWISETHETHELTDRIGSGDAFMAGLITAIYQQLSPQETVDLATQTGFKKLFFPGDFIKENLSHHE